MKKTILIVDDENTIREVVGRYLVHAGFAVREAHTGTEALDAIRQQVPDL
ncbi:MAG: response regulator, partial [Anaerolineae bacterium]